MSIYVLTYISSFDGVELFFYSIISVFIILITSALLTFIILNRYRRNTFDEDINNIEIAGFTYSEEQDIFYSVIDAWQRDYGYCHFYDVMSTPLSMVIDSEPVIFEYNNKLWLIEFWKGQYGMTTGAEVGIYCTNKKKKQPKKLLFESIDDDDFLQMSYILFKNNEVYFTRTDKHWWLTGFKLGDFSNPDELKMDIRISFKNTAMQEVFVKALYDIGYTADKVSVLDNNVNILYDKPYSKQPWTRNKLLEGIAQTRNSFFVDTYQNLTGEADNFVDKMELLKKQRPKLYNKIKTIGFSKRFYTSISFFKRKRKGSD